MADNSENIEKRPDPRRHPKPQTLASNEPPTTGHEWDGIREYDNPMPRWWVWIFIITIVWSVGYWVAYPAWPGIQSSTAGLLGYSSRANVAADIAEFEASNEQFFVQLLDTDLDEIRENDELHRFAINAGGSVFRAQCSQCHGTGGAGVQASGFPNLLNDEWLWGGTMEDIHQTIRYGIRNEDFPDARWSEMPAFGRDGLLDNDEIDQVTHFVLSLSGADHDAALAALGQEAYEINCASCHMDDGSGDYFIGAPALNTQVWLYGGSFEAIRESIYYSRFGVMPGFAGRLRDAEIRAVAAYVHQLGGGQ